MTDKHFPNNEHCSSDGQKTEIEPVYYPLQRALKDISASIPAIGDAMGDDRHTATVDIGIAEDCLSRALSSLAEAKRRAAKREGA